MNFDEICPYLLVGSCPRTPDHVDELVSHKVTAVLNLQTDEDLEYWEIDWPELQSRYKAAQMQWRRVPVRDFDPEQLRKRLPECVETLHELTKAGHRVLVHCNVGKNRSPSTAIAYLHSIEAWPLDQAIVHVWECRRCEPYVDAIKLATQDRRDRSSSRDELWSG